MARLTPREPTPVQKYAAAVWRAPNNPTIHAMLDTEYSAAGAFVERYNARFGVKLTPTHLTARALGLLLKELPEGNAVVGLRGFWQRDSADVSFAIINTERRDVGIRKLEAVDTLSLAAIEQSLRRVAADERDGKNPTFEKAKATMRRMPLWLARPLSALTVFAVNNLGLDLSRYGAPPDPYGSAIISAVGVFGYETAFTTPIPQSRCPMYLMVMEVRDMPWIDGEDVVKRPVLRLCITADHRVVDGYLGGEYMKGMKGYLLEPERLLTPEEAAAW